MLSHKLPPDSEKNHPEHNAQRRVVANFDQSSTRFVSFCHFHLIPIECEPILSSTAHSYHGASCSPLRFNTNFAKNKKTDHCVVLTLEQAKSQIFGFSQSIGGHVNGLAG